jgi:hypothetical protein
MSFSFTLQQQHHKSLASLKCVVEIPREEALYRMSGKLTKTSTPMPEPLSSSHWQSQGGPVGENSQEPHKTLTVVDDMHVQITLQYY